MSNFYVCRPPPPPEYLNDTMPMTYGTAGPSQPLTEDFGGEDNAAYDMSRSPSAEASAANNGNGMTTAGLHHLQLRLGHVNAPGAVGGMRNYSGLNMHHSHSGLSMHHSASAHNMHPSTSAHNMHPSSSGHTIHPSNSGLSIHRSQSGMTVHGTMDNGMQLMQFSPTLECNRLAGACATTSLTNHALSTHPLSSHPPPLPPCNPGMLQGPVQFSPSGELNLGSPHHQQVQLQLQQQIAYHSRLDSGLSEPSCDSPGANSNNSGGGGCNSNNTSAGGAPSSLNSQDRPQSQASQSSHSTDSEDSGFRSSRSGHHIQNQTNHDSKLKRSRSGGGRSKGRGFYQKAATSSPESETEPGIQLTPTALWPHHYNVVPTSSPSHHSSAHPQRVEDDTLVKTSAVDLKMTPAPHLEWKYLQDLASPRNNKDASRGHGQGHGHAQSPQSLTCHQSMTLAQVHSPRDMDNPDVFGFSVV